MERKIRTNKRNGFRKGFLGAAAALGMALMPMQNAKAVEYTNAVVNNITNDMRLTWNWTNQYSFAAIPSAGGSVSGTTNGWYDEGTVVSQTASNDIDKVFKYWTGVPSGSESNNPVSFPLDGPYTNVQAVFDWKKVNLSVVSSNGTPTGAGAYNYGSSATSTVERVIDVSPGVRRRVTGYSLENL